MTASLSTGIGRVGVWVLAVFVLGCCFSRVWIHVNPANSAAASGRLEYGVKYWAVGGRKPPPFTSAVMLRVVMEMTQE